MHSYVYITSSSYSGSTLLSLILGSHRRIASVGELHGPARGVNLQTYVCSCGQPYLQCDFWQGIERAMRNRGFPGFSLSSKGTLWHPRSEALLDRLQFADLRSNLLETVRDLAYGASPAHRRYVREITAKNTALATVITQALSAEIFVDASKVLPAIPHLHRAMPSAFHLIHLIRDGRGVLWSFGRNQPQIPGETAVRQWRLLNEWAERVGRQLDSTHQIRIRYEDLCTDPRGTISRVCEWLGVEFEDACLRYGEPRHHVIGNRMRLAQTQEIRLNREWETGLPEEQRRIFERLAGDYNRSLGYDSP